MIRVFAPYFFVYFAMQYVLRLAFLTLHYNDIQQFLYACYKSLPFDLTVFCFHLLVPLTALFFNPSKKVLSSIFAIWCCFIFFITASEYLFWIEFSSRFNFIAVDYLIYTHEVIGNIVESYPVFLILSLIACVSLCLSYAYFVYIKDVMLWQKSAIFKINVFCVVLSSSIASALLLDNSSIDSINNQYSNQIARNGMFELFSAYRNNELDFEKFYITKEFDSLFGNLKKKLGIEHKNPDITRFVENQNGVCRDCNVIVIVEESFSAKFLKFFGNQENIAPNFDELIKKSIFFSNMHAIGTRTVYGLSAITLSMPPLPGNAMIRREGTDNLFSIGSVLRGNDYSTTFLYGGFGYFDNMNTFFAGNGFDVVDRSNFSKEEISFANIWGVCDEDLFDKALKEADKQSGKFLQIIMTTSNHRPYTYPDGKIDISSGYGRSGGVKYADYALGQFLKKSHDKKWFNNTVFAIVADHTASSAGKEDLSVGSYHIPFLMYWPAGGSFAAVNNSLSSQIDIAPTILGFLGINYNSKFFGENLLLKNPNRAFLSNYQKLGYLVDDKLLVLKPIKNSYMWDKKHDEWLVSDVVDEDMLFDALSYYQVASKWRMYSKKSQ